MKIAFLYLTILSLILAQDMYPTVIFDTTQPLEANTNTFYVSENGDFDINGTTSHSYRIPLVAHNLYLLLWGTEIDGLLFIIEDQTGWNHLFTAADNFDLLRTSMNALIFEIQNSGFYNITISCTNLNDWRSQSFTGWGIFDVPEIIPGEEYIDRIPSPGDLFYAGYINIQSTDLEKTFLANSSNKLLFLFNPLISSEDYRFHPCNHDIEISLGLEFTFNQTGRYIIYERDSFDQISVKTTISTSKISGYSSLWIGTIIGIIILSIRKFPRSADV